MKLVDPQSIRRLLPLCMLASVSVCSAHELTINVQSEHGEGVESNIFYVIETDRSLIGRTDENGQLLPETPCRIPQDIEAEPTNPMYISGKAYCAVNSGTIVVKVFNKQFTNRIVHTFENYATEGNHALEALLANELYVRYAVSDTAAAKAYEARIRPAAVEYLIASNFLTVSGGTVNANQFETAIRNLQQARGLTVTGKLDYQTLSSAAGVDIGEIIATDDFHLDRTRIQP